MRRSSRLIALFTGIFILLSPLTSSALTLQEGLKIVTESGRDVAIAHSDEEVAKGAVSLARSPWLPQLDLYGRETWLYYQPAIKIGPAGTPVPTSQDQFMTYGFKATQLLYDFGKTSSSINAAQFGLKAQEAETFRARNRAALEFIVAYFDLLESEELLKVAQDEVTRYEAHGKDASARFKAGVVTRNEVLQADVLLADSKQRLLTAENNRTLRASKVNSILVRPLNEPVQAAGVVSHALGTVQLEQAWAEAEQSNPDLRNLDARVRAKEENISSVRSEHLPTVYVSGGYEYSENQYQLHPDNWSVIAGVNINLFAGGSTSSRISMGKSEVLSLRLGREKLLDAIRLETQSAWLDVQSSTRKVEVAASAVNQSAENLRLQRLRYQQGVGTSTEVLDAVTLMTTAETNASKANFGVKRAEAALQYTMGRDLAAVYGGK
jgi:outer membrane protein TolC